MLKFLRTLQHVTEIDLFIAWFGPSFFGACAKLANDWRLDKTLSLRNIVASIIIGTFVGYCFDVMCTIWYWGAARGIICGFAGLLSGEIIKYVLGNSKDIIPAFIKRVFNIEFIKKTKENGDQPTDQAS